MIGLRLLSRPSRSLVRAPLFGKHQCFSNATASIHQRLTHRLFSSTAAQAARAEPSIDLKALSQAVRADCKTKDITILFGSQTGTAKLFAHELAKQANAKKYNAKVLDLASYKSSASQLSKDGLVVFVLACFGHGEPTSNAQGFWDWMLSPQRLSERNEFAGVRYAVFGLGQSKQHPENYQAVGRAVDVRLSDLAACRFMDRGEGDDSGDIEADFDAWTEKLWERLDAIQAGESPYVPLTTVPLIKAIGYERGGDASPATATAAPAKQQPSDALPQPQPVATASAQTSSSTSSTATAQQEQQAPVTDRVCHARILQLRELHTPLSGRSCKHIEFEIGPDMTYQPGDWVGVVPENNTQQVSKLAHRLGYGLDTPVSIAEFPLIRDIARTFHCHQVVTPTPGSTILAESCSLVGGACDGHADLSLETVLTKLVDITAPPRRAVLKLLSESAKDEEKDKLRFMASPTPLGNADYNWLVDNGVTITELLDMFLSIRPRSIPLSDLLSVLSPLQPRYYSISSSQLKYPRAVHITTALVNYCNHLGAQHQGVCTSFLARQSEGRTVPIFIKPSLFKLPTDPSTPIIMIGAGTGLAPFRAFLQHRLLQQERGSCSNPISCEGKDPTNLLFFGCNNRHHDFIYREELHSLQVLSKGSIQAEYAFAFEKPWRVFVQHRMVEPANAARIWRMLNKGAYVYVCGSSKTVAPGALEAMVQIAQTEGKLSRPNAEAMFKQMQHDRRYQLDVF